MPGVLAGPEFFGLYSGPPARDRAAAKQPPRGASIFFLLLHAITRIHTTGHRPPAEGATKRQPGPGTDVAVPQGVPRQLRGRSLPRQLRRGTDQGPTSILHATPRLRPD